MLDRGYLDPVQFQTGRQPSIADAERVCLEIDRRLEVNAAENNARIRLGRTQRERNLDPGVETHAGSLDN
jgi:hypothetical protein